MNKIISVIVIILAAAFVFNGCLKDNVSPNYNFIPQSNALLLNYVESQGDIITNDSLSLYVTTDK